MPEQSARTIQIISHGPSCLDGVMAAAAVARFYDGDRVLTALAGNSDSDRAIQGLNLRSRSGADDIWITDLSWTQTATAEHLNELVSDGARIFWIDHHRTAVSRAQAPEFKVQFTAKILSEQYSAARLAFNYLRKLARKRLSGPRAQAYEEFAPFAAIADDHDRWIHRIPESSDWALAVQTLGGMASYREILKLREPRMTRKLKNALEIGQDGMRRSLELAKATLTDRMLPSGIKVRAACCFGYSSEVASHLYQAQQHTVVALFDLRSQGVSLRRSIDCDVDLSLLAESFGGGGHAAASGFALPELRRLPAEKLVELLGDRLQHQSFRLG
jgi:oligoribonuclease NrnB/cAMP/cGMP phosphodiesterase (DHH superfamily)